MMGWYYLRRQLQGTKLKSGPLYRSRFKFSLILVISFCSSYGIKVEDKLKDKEIWKDVVGFDKRYEFFFVFDIEQSWTTVTASRYTKSKI